MSAEVSEVVIIVLAGTFLMLLLVTFIVSFFFLHQRRQTQNRQDKAAMQAAFQQEILQTQLEVQNLTMQQLGRELHDNIGQLLSVLRLNLNVLEETVEDEGTRGQIAESNQIVEQTIADVRALTKSLDGDFVKDFGFIDSLSHELQRIRKTRRYQTEITTSGTPYSLGYQHEIVLFRIAQEVINNALKHAAATTLTVSVMYEPTNFEITIQDNGKGFDFEGVMKNGMSKSGAGLRNIQRRAELIGGKCTINSQKGLGTTVTISIQRTQTGD